MLHFTTVNCSLPEEPSNGTIVDYERLNETVLEGTVLTYQCDNGLSLTGPNTITCTNDGVWSTDLDTIMCLQESEYSFVNGSHQYLRFSTDPITAPLFTGATIAISVVISSFISIVIGFLAGLLVMHLCSRKKAVYFPAAEGQANVGPTNVGPTNVGPTVPAGPVYEEVSPKEEIELNSNQAYGPVGL